MTYFRRDIPLVSFWGGGGGVGGPNSDARRVHPNHLWLGEVGPLDPVAGDHDRRGDEDEAGGDKGPEALPHLPDLLGQAPEAGFFED